MLLKLQNYIRIDGKSNFFFKCKKQNLTIKTLWGHSENAVNIHIWVAFFTNLIVAKIKHTLK